MLKIPSFLLVQIPGNRQVTGSFSTKLGLWNKALGLGILISNPVHFGSFRKLVIHN